MEWKQASSIEGGYKIPSEWVYLRYYEVFNVLFRIENAIRVFVYVVLKDELRDKWADAQVSADDEDGTIASLSKKRMRQARSFGYLGHNIACPIMYLNSGELTRLIVSEAYWKLFKPYFLGSKEIIKSKLDEIQTIRNSIAHFRPIRSDDVNVIKQNSKHVLIGIEQFVNQVLNQYDVIPTNTADDWYINLNTLGTDHCSFSFQQSPDEHWVGISIHYCCPVINKHSLWKEFTRYTVLTIKSSAILTTYDEIAKDICYLSENVSYPQTLKDGGSLFGKTLTFVISRTMLESHHADIKTAIEKLLRMISNETELIKQDNLARGQIVHSAVVSVSTKTVNNKLQYEWEYQKLYTPVAENDPPEYWGGFSFMDYRDFVA